MKVSEIALGALAVAAIWPATALAVEPAGKVSLRTVPEAVCLDTRPTPHLNFDLVIGNATARELKIGEMRAMMLNPRDEVVERRILWQEGLAVLAPDKTVAAGKEGLVFNPFAFNSLKPGARIRYEIDFEGAAAPATIVVKPRSCVTRARLVLPLTGRVLVYDGHDFLSHHRRQSDYLRPDLKAFGLVDNWYRFGLDLLPVDAQGGFFRGDGGRMQDWYGWGRPVRAAGAGVVVAVRDTQPDNDKVWTENRWVPKKLSEDEMDADGNYVLIDHGHGEMSLATHLRQGSARVRKGDRVRADQVVAEVGASGSAPVPHLHYELRTGLGVRGVHSLPAYFHDLTVLGTGEGAGPVAVNTGDVLMAR